MSTGLRIGLVGAGNMGSRMARRVHAAGEDIVAFDADPERVRAAGLPLAASLGALVRDTDLVLFSLPDSRVIEAVVNADDGVLANAFDGQVIVDLSTAAPQSTVALHARLAEHGAELVDAGVSGGAAAAEKGTLTIMAGGSKDALDRAMPVLDLFSGAVHHMGPSGSGHATKVLNNFLNGVSLAATAEVMVAARKFGLDLPQFLEVVNASTGVNFATLNRFPHIVQGDYLEGGLTSNLMAKDIMLYLEMARELEVTSINGPPCLASFHLAAALGYGDQISNRVVDALGDLAGGVRVHDIDEETTA